MGGRSWSLLSSVFQEQVPVLEDPALQVHSLEHKDLIYTETLVAEDNLLDQDLRAYKKQWKKHCILLLEQGKRSVMLCDFAGAKKWNRNTSGTSCAKLSNFPS